MSEPTSEHETPEVTEVEEIEVVAHSDDDERPACVINRSAELAP
jgi:hypothetical protein